MLLPRPRRAGLTLLGTVTLTATVAAQQTWTVAAAGGGQFTQIAGPNGTPSSACIETRNVSAMPWIVGHLIVSGHSLPG